MVDYRPRRKSRLKQKGGRIYPSFSLKRILADDRFIKYALIALVGCLILIPIIFFLFSRDLPTPGKLITSKYKDATRIYDRKGVLLYSVYEDENRTYVKLDQIPKKLQEATISIEDKDFYKNKGFSPIGYVRVGWNFLRGKGLAGASTISQQLVKNVLLTSERSVTRKIKELILSIQVNNVYSKQEILEMYLNNIPYGGTAVGVEAAAQMYFGKKSQELDIAESAFLAGLPQSPSLYSPYTGNDYYIGRTQAVLKEMREDGYITKKEADQALQKIKNYKFSEKNAVIKAPHFVMYVKKLLADQFGENVVLTGGLQVTTTLDYELQEQAETIVKEEVEKLKGYRVGNGAAMVTDPKTGEILAMVGSKDYFDEENDGNFNAATQGNRQPGSSLKPIIYAQALEKGYTAASMLMDVKTEFAGGEGQPSYSPVNYDGKFRGPVQLRFALGNSLNIPAVKLLALVGVKDTMQKAYDMGISNWEPTSENMKNVGLSLVLGGRETTLFDEMTAYGVFANKGVKQDLYSIAKVTNNKGKTLYEHKKKDGDKVLSEEVAFIISHMLLDNNARVDAFGPNSFLRIPGKTVAVKTGTTDEKRDNWTFGYTPSYVVGVWVGNNDNSPMNQNIASGITGASPIWNRIIKVALEDKSDEPFQVPGNVEAKQVDSFGGGLPVDGQASRSEYFVKGTEPTTKAPIYKNKDGKDYFVFREDDPVSADGKNRWQEGIDAWIEQNHKGDDKWNPPGELKENKEATPTPTPGSETPTPTPSP
jgi:1A family penicillin-binding protein